MRFALAVVNVTQFLSIKIIVAFVIAEIFNAINILLVFARFTDFVVGRFGVCMRSIRSYQDMCSFLR